MPEINLTGLYPDDLWTIQSCMYFPNDEHMRIGSYLRQYVATGGDMEGSIILDTPDRERVKNVATSAAEKGYVVGTVVYFLYEMVRHNFERKSLMAARELTRRNLDYNASYGNDKRITLSERTMINYWNEFSSCAHLYGAFVLNQHIPHIPHEKLFSEDYLHEFLGLALTLQNFLTSFQSPGKTGKYGLPLSIDHIWSVPSYIPQKVPSKIDLPDIFFDFAKK